MAEEIERKFEEPMFRLNRKQNYKGETGFEYTVRANSIDELKALDSMALKQAMKSKTEVMQGE